MKNYLQSVVLLLLVLLAGCSSVPSDRSRSSAALSTAPAASSPVGQPAPKLPKAGSGRGAYYKDDGPGENPPAGLELTLDAEPKVEPYSTACNKPYVVFGKTYTPLLDNQAFSQRGIGSWYGIKFHGQKTSSGEPYDMYKMTAAHPTLPIPSYARITNTANGKQVIVKINDRGPFHTNRIVDLSYTAALKLEYLGKGSSELLLERLLPADIEKMAENKKSQAVAVAAAAPEVKPVAAVAAAGSAGFVSPADSAGYEALLSSKTAVPVAQPEVAASVPVVTDTPNTASGFYLQFGAFGLRSNAEATFTRLQSKLAQLPTFEIVQQGTLYRLFSGPFVSRAQASEAIQLAQNVGVTKPVIVQR